MNKQRKNRLMVILNKMLINIDELYSVLDEEQNSFDNLPEGLQGSDKGMESEEYLTEINSLIESMQNGIDNIKEI